MAQIVGSSAVVPVKSALTSKVNWLAALAGGVNWLDVFTHPLPSSLGDAAIAGAKIIVPALIIVARTWFSHSVVASST